MEQIRNKSQKKDFFRLIVVIGFLALFAFGISSCNLPDLGLLLNAATPTELPDSGLILPTPDILPTEEVQVLQSRTIIVWVPPQFNPDSGTVAGNLFMSRLDEFSSRRPQINVEVRVKPLAGEFGLLDSLRITGTAAPILKPDLIALPRSLMEQAYREGLVINLDDIKSDLPGDELYSYARDLALVDENVAGLPFAGDLLALAFKVEPGFVPPPDWESILSYQKALAFPASDIKSLITLAYYQSLGGELIPDSSSYRLTGDVMLEVLKFYQQAQSFNVMPYWLTQFETKQQAWQSYLDRQSTLSLTWSSIILGSDSANTSLAAIPTKEGKAFSYADGWAWSVIPSDLETEEVALELAEFLTAESYLSIWGLEAGYLPVHPASLASWSERTYYPTLQKLLPAAVLIPDNDLITKLGPQIRTAVVSVLKDQVDPSEALNALLGVIPAP